MRVIEGRRGRAASVVALVSALGLLGCAAPISGNNPYQRALDEIRTQYIAPVDEEQLQANSLRGILTGLDPHSDYLDEAEYRALMSDAGAEYAGIGVELGERENRLTILAAFEGAPAAQAGLRPGDVIVSVDGSSVGMSPFTEGLSLLSGPAGAAVTLTIARRGRPPFDVSVMRTVIPDRSVVARLEHDRIGYVRISAFSQRTEAKLREALDLLHRKAGGRLAGLVLDLRSNPGGLLEVAASVAADFLDGGTIVTTRGRDPRGDMTYAAAPNGDLTKGAPMAVLIDGRSISAAEIVAGALQDNGRAVLVGSRTFGKGSVQTLIPIPGLGALQLTTARYYTPSGRSIQAQGIEPDQLVWQPRQTNRAQLDVLREADLPNALRNTGPIGPTTVAVASVPRERPDGEGTHAGGAAATTGALEDIQLAAAVALLREHGREPQHETDRAARRFASRRSP